MEHMFITLDKPSHCTG